jgi:PIN domain nuclease of toxin-antitoxin system
MAGWTGIMPQYNAHRYNEKQYNQHSYYKLLADSISSSDALVKSVSKILTSAITLSESRSVLFAKATFTDSVALTDLLTKSMYIDKIDAIVLSEQITRAVSKSLSDSVTPTDSIARVLSRLLNDSIFMNELVTKLVSNKALHDNVRTDEWTSGKNADQQEWTN